MISFSIRNPLFMNLLLCLVVIAGLLSWFAMPQEMFPLIELDQVQVTTIYEGAPPEDVERQVTLTIEEAFEGKPDIDVMLSSSREGLSTVSISLKSGSNVDDFMRDARNTLDTITDLPDEAESPELTRLETRFPVISLAVYGDVGTAYLSEIADNIKDKLQTIKGVASIGAAGLREWEIWVQVNPDVLAARQVSLQTLQSALRKNLRDLPGGTLKASEGDILLRGTGVSPQPDSIRAIVLKSLPGSGQLLLGDVAKVDRRLEESETLGRFNGKPSVNLTVSKTAQASTIEVSDRVQEMSRHLINELPPSVQVDVFSDFSVYVRNRLNTVKSSGVIGLVLVLLSLYLFLNFRVAFITALGIPVAFLVAVIALYYLGYTINMVSLFAFLIALGMIVDDAIIVNENIYRHMEEGMAARPAALKGTREVFWPVIASTTTTIAAFLPMFAIGGTLGEFITVIPVVVTASLLGSLFEAFGVLPSHAAEFLHVQKASPVRKRLVDWGALLKRYTRLLRTSLNMRYVTAAITISVLAITMTYAQTRLPFKLFAHVDTGQFFINIETPNTYSLQDSEKLAKQIEQTIMTSLGEDELNTLLTNVGFTFIDNNRFRTGSQYIQSLVDLKKRKPQGFIERFISPVVSFKFSYEGAVRERDTPEIMNQLRAELGELPGVKRMSILRPRSGPAGKDIEIGISGRDSTRLRIMADEVAAYLQKLPGVKDVHHDMEPGKLEYQYALNARGRELGLSQQDIGDAVRTGFLGLEVVQVTVENKRIPVRLIYADSVRHRGELASLPLTLESGEVVFLGDVATLTKGRALDTVNRRDMKRLATISAEVDDKVTTPRQVTAAVQKQYARFSEQNKGYELQFLGEKKKSAESFEGMGRALLISLAIIFFILSALFKSLLDPLVVMFAIPFGMIGVVVGHVLFSYQLQFLSIVGFLALAGIIVNDSLILIDFAKRMRAEGMERIDAMVEAGRVRVRPILLTTITTFLGVSPLIFFATGQTAFLSPMAISLGFGLLFATALILLALPSFYMIADDWRLWTCKRVRHLLGKPPLSEDQAEYCRLSDVEMQDEG